MVDYFETMEKLMELLIKDHDIGANDPNASFNYQKSPVPLEAARRIALFHHIPDKIDLIIAALEHPYPEVKKIGLKEYKSLPLDVRNDAACFPEPEKFKVAVREIEKKLKVG